MIFKNMAIILVKLNTENIQSLLRILRVKCMSCKSTHAVLLYFIVPYSQYALEVHLKALQSDFLNTFIDWIEWNEEINEYSYYYIRSQFQKYWKERLISESMRLNPDLLKNCFKFFHYNLCRLNALEIFFYPSPHKV